MNNQRVAAVTTTTGVFPIAHPSLLVSVRLSGRQRGSQAPFQCRFIPLSLSRLTGPSLTPLPPLGGGALLLEEVYSTKGGVLLLEEVFSTRGGVLLLEEVISSQRRCTPVEEVLSF